jgi:outer membrane lipoprotein SlyB
MKKIGLALMVLFGIVLAGDAFAQDPIVFPAEGQSNEQIEKDKFDCYQWAKNETGFDPMQVPTATSVPPQAQAQGGRAVGGAALGAAAGAAIKRDGSRSKGAATGALVGGLLGGASTQAQRQQDEMARRQWEQEQAAIYAQQRTTYNRAYAACLESKGYTVR